MAAVQPAWPSVKPHLLFVPHTLFVHWFAAVHATPMGAAQVFVFVLHEPLAHTFAAVAQVPSWRVSLETATPGARSAVHV